jgi:hypothetical protein
MAKNGSSPPPLQLEKPDGTSINLPWQKDEGGELLSANLPMDNPGIYTVVAGGERRFLEFGLDDKGFGGLSRRGLSQS